MEQQEHSISDNILSGPIAPTLWRLSWPMMLSVFFYTLYNIVDAYWVSKLSPESIAAVSISQITLFLMMSIGFGVTVGSGVIMSMDIGAKNRSAAERVLGQSFVLMAIAGVVFTIFSLLFRNQLLTVSGASGAIFQPALEYFTITSGGCILFFILVAIMFGFNAQGDTLTLTKLFAFSTAINLFCDPLLIFGWKWIPAMGISGAAYSTLISQFCFIIVALKVLSSPKRDISFHCKNLSFQWESVKRVLRIGIPAAMTQLNNPVGTAALTYISSAVFLEAGAVAFSLGFRIEFFAYLPAVGFGIGAMAMMGQNIGAENMERTKEVLRVALRFAMSIALVLGLIAMIFSSQIIGFFTDDPTVTEYASSYFHIVALSYAFLAAMMVEASAFQAVGKSWPGFWISFLRFIVITIPVSLLLTVVLGHSISGIWYALVAGNIVSSIVGYFWIQKTLAKFDFTQVEEATHAH